MSAGGGGGVGGGEGGGGWAVDERCVTLGGVPSSVTKRYNGVGGGGVKSTEKKRYVTLEWPLCQTVSVSCVTMHSDKMNVQ